MATQLVQMVVGTRDPVPVNPLGGQIQVTVASSGGTLYYADNVQVSSTSNQGSINPGSSQTFTRPQYVIASQPGTALSMTITDGDTLSPLNWPFRL